MLTKHERPVLRMRTADDEAFLTALFHECRLAEFLPLQLPAEALHQLLDMQSRAQAMSYSTQFPEAQDCVIWMSEQRVGRSLVDRSASTVTLIDLAIAEPFRGQGIGTALLRDLLTEAHAAKLPVRLHVRLSNPAAKLYLRLGFVPLSGNETDVFLEASPET